MDLDESFDSSDGSVELSTDRPSQPLERSGHVAVKHGKYIFIIGGYRLVLSTPQTLTATWITDRYLDMNLIWLYDIEFDMWRHVITSDYQLPPSGLSGAVGVAIGKSIFLQGGNASTGNVNTVWKLGRGETFLRGELVWSELRVGNQNTACSPRDKHAGWEYDDKLWIFGGYGPPPNGYMFSYGKFYMDDEGSGSTRGWNNQLFSFDVVGHRWTEICPSGAVPSPRAAHAIAPIRDDHSKLLLFGGRTLAQRLDDLYQLDMCTLTFTKLQTMSVDKPVGRTWHSFNVIGPGHVILHGGYSSDGQPLNDTWDFDVSKMSWRRISNITPDHLRLWHTGTTAMDHNNKNQRVVVFGGCETNIFVGEEQNMCNDVYTIQMEPPTLQKMALFAVHQYRDVLEESELTDLPGNLQGCLRDLTLAGETVNIADLHIR